MEKKLETLNPKNLNPKHGVLGAAVAGARLLLKTPRAEASWRDKAPPSLTGPIYCLGGNGKAHGNYCVV